MKKFTAALLLCAIGCLWLTACGGAYAWEQQAAADIATLTENGFSMYMHDNANDVREANEICGSELEKRGYRNVTVINICGLKDDGPGRIVFVRFADRDDARYYYDFSLKEAEDEAIRYCLKGDILIFTNSKMAMNLLKYEFE